MKTAIKYGIGAGVLILIAVALVENLDTKYIISIAVIAIVFFLARTVDELMTIRELLQEFGKYK